MVKRNERRCQEEGSEGSSRRQGKRERERERDRRRERWWPRRPGRTTMDREQNAESSQGGSGSQESGRENSGREGLKIATVNGTAWPSLRAFAECSEATVICGQETKLRGHKMRRANIAV